MTTQEIDRLCAEAMARLKIFINKLAGQHLRAMRKSWSKK